MKERQILFKEEMIRAILDGRKTQTRRVLEPRPEPFVERIEFLPGVGWCPTTPSGKIGVFKRLSYECHFGASGDVLRVIGSEVFLTITDIRVERLWNIDATDCLAEGIRPRGVDPVDIATNLMDDFRKLWDDINAGRGFAWDTNPWVWVIAFRQGRRGEMTQVWNLLEACKRALFFIEEGDDAFSCPEETQAYALDTIREMRDAIAAFEAATDKTNRYE